MQSLEQVTIAILSIAPRRARMRPVSFTLRTLLRFLDRWQQQQQQHNNNNNNNNFKCDDYLPSSRNGCHAMRRDAGPRLSDFRLIGRSLVELGGATPARVRAAWGSSLPCSRQLPRSFPVSLDGDSFPRFSSHTLREQTRCSIEIREGKGSPGQKHCPTSRNIGCLVRLLAANYFPPKFFSRQKLGTCFRYFLQVVDVFIVRNGMFEKVEGCLNFSWKSSLSYKFRRS